MKRKIIIGSIYLIFMIIAYVYCFPVEIDIIIFTFINSITIMTLCLIFLGTIPPRWKYSFQIGKHNKISNYIIILLLIIIVVFGVANIIYLFTNKNFESTVYVLSCLQFIYNKDRVNYAIKNIKL